MVHNEYYDLDVLFVYTSHLEILDIVQKNSIHTNLILSFIRRDS